MTKELIRFERGLGCKKELNGYRFSKVYIDEEYTDAFYGLIKDKKAITMLLYKKHKKNGNKSI